MKAAYAHAVEQKYRFFSYGDCCLLFRRPRPRILEEEAPVEGESDKVVDADAAVTEQLKNSIPQEIKIETDVTPDTNNDGIEQNGTEI
jgi:hypothetical protein